MPDAAFTTPSTDALVLRRRNDLQVYPQLRRSRKVWVIKDPVALRYFQLRAEEFAILQWLDGRTGLREIKDRFDGRFAPRHITLSRLHQFVGGLHRNGLALSDAEGQGEQLLIRHRDRQSGEWWAMLTNPLAIRFRGFDPTRFLDWMDPKLKWIFSPTFALVYLSILCLALYSLVMGQEQFFEKLPQIDSLMTPGNWIFLAAAMALTKVIHELGHALACRHYGARCHEMGVMLLIFTPCLYCNVTDAWKLPSRWQRVVIGAAGILVEIGLAALCFLLWWYSQPGLLNTLCLNITIVCSVGTVLLNGNPLLRYDGYYILSDALDLTNLWQDSRSGLNRLVSRLTMGIDPGAPPSQQDRPGLVLLYGVASAAYRIVVVSSILYLVYRFCQPLGLAFVAQMLAAVMIVSFLSKPVTAVWKTMRNPILRRRMRPTRLLGSVALCSLLIIAAAIVPLPCRVRGTALIETLDADRVYVTVPGSLLNCVDAGTVVEKGQMLGKLENIQIERELESVRGQMERQAIRLRNLQTMRGQRPDIAAQLPAAAEILDDLKQRLAQLQRDRSALTLTAPINGVILEPPSVGPRRSEGDLPDAPLPYWTGSPMDKSNLGSHLDRKTLFCLVGQPDAFEASVFIDQSDIRYVREDQTVKLLLDCGEGRIVRGIISQVSRVNVRSAPRSLATDKPLRSETLADTAASVSPEQTAYKAQIRIDSAEIAMLVGARGDAKILVERQPLLQQVRRFLSRTFKPVI